MKRILFLLMALLTGVSGAWAQSVYSVNGRASSVATGKQYMIYNTARRYFLSASGSRYAITNNTAPLNFATTSANYVWTLEEGTTSGTYKIKNVGTSTYSAGGTTLGSAVDYTIEEFSTCPNKGGMTSYNDDGSTTPAADISASDNTVYIVANGTTAYWNGTGDAFNTHTAAHVYVLYEVNEIDNYRPSIPENVFLNIGEKVSSFAVATSDVDNDHWYVMTQTRGGDSPIYDVGTGSTVYRAAAAITASALEEASAKRSSAYLVRFISVDDGLYNIQFADGNFINASLQTANLRTSAGKFAFYNTSEESTTFGWNLNSNTGSIVDNNGPGNSLAFLGSGTVTASTGNNVWSLYPVVITDAVSYSFDVTSGAFFQGLTTNVVAAATTYCNLWLSKNTQDKPQLKLITDDAALSGGNNIRSTGGLYTKNGSETYNISVSEGKIKAYTIVGTAGGALSITPNGGSAENFEESASVNKKVILATPAKQTSFTLAGSGKWLDVSKFFVEWETDGSSVSNVSEVTNDGIYTIAPYNAERGALYAGETYLDACGGHANTYYPANASTAIDATDPNQQFVLYNYGGNTYLYNVGRAKFVGVADDLYYKFSGAPVNTWTLTNGTYTGYFHLNSQTDSKMATINAWTHTGSADSKDYGVTGNTANEDANNLVLRRVGTLTSELQTAIQTVFNNYTTLQNNLNTLEQYNIGTGLGQYTHPSYPTNENKEALINDIRNSLKGCTSSVIPSTNTQIQGVISSMSLNMPANGSFIRIVSAEGKYLSSAEHSSGRIIQQDNADNYTIYYFKDCQLLNYGAGIFGNGRERGSVGADGLSNYTFQESELHPGTGCYNLRFNPDGGNLRYLYCWATSHTDYPRTDQNSSDAEACQLTLKAVTELPVTISAAGYATFNCPVAVTIPKGVTAYQAYVRDGQYVNLVSIDDGVIPANFPVVLKGTPGTYNFPITTTELTSADYQSNQLQGSVAAMSVAVGDIYTLQRDSETTVGFYPNAGTTFKGFSAYLTSAGNSRGFQMVTPTGIEEVASPELHIENAYDLQGRRAGQVKKGVYIVNGKKVLF